MVLYLRLWIIAGVSLAVLGACGCSDRRTRVGVIPSDEMPNLPERGSAIGFQVGVEGASVPTRDLVGKRLLEPVEPTPEERAILGDTGDPYAFLFFPPPPQPGPNVWAETGGATVYAAGRAAVYGVGDTRRVSMAGPSQGAVYLASPNGRSVSMAGSEAGTIVHVGPQEGGAAVASDPTTHPRVGVERRPHR